MSWVTVGVTAASMLMASQKQKKQQENADSQRKLASETARYSPWTGMTPNQVQEPENTAFGSVLGGGMAGYSMGRGMSGGMGAKPQAAPLTAQQNQAFQTEAGQNAMMDEDGFARQKQAGYGYKGFGNLG